MERNWKEILSGAGFYTALTVCLLVVGVCGYYLLFGQPKAEPEHTETAAVQPVEVTAPVQAPAAPEPDTEPKAPEVVETLAPEPAPAPVMPEVKVDSAPVVAEAPRLIVEPLKGEVIAAFSMDKLIYDETMADWRTHNGVDIAAKPGTTVLAACSGVVCSVTDDALMGTTVVLEHPGGYQTTYANLQRTPNVEAGDTVSAGQIIGAVGSTAAAEAASPPHLHFAVSKDGEAVEPQAFLER